MRSREGNTTFVFSPRRNSPPRGRKRDFCGEKTNVVLLPQCFPHDFSPRREKKGRKKAEVKKKKERRQGEEGEKKGRRKAEQRERKREKKG